MLGIAAEGTLAPGAPPFRAVVIGDGDFASNSFLPYMANSDLLLAAVRWLAREERSTAVAHAHPGAADDPADGRAEPRGSSSSSSSCCRSPVIALGGVVWWRRR